MTPIPIEASCHCGAIRLHLAAAPDVVTDCPCSICRRYGVRWAYYAPEQVRIVAPAAGDDVYVWGDREIGFHRCKVCGCVTHWAALEPGADRMGVNARLMDPDVLASARRRTTDGNGRELTVED